MRRNWLLWLVILTGLLMTTSWAHSGPSDDSEKTKGGQESDGVGAVEMTMPPMPTLPYEGSGSVAILSDGTLLLLIETEDGSENAAEEDPNQSFEARTFMGQLDTTGLMLVKHGGNVFLDRRGTELARRGLSMDQVFALSFPDGNQCKVSPKVHPDGDDFVPWSVVEFSGALQLKWKTQGKVPALAVKLVDVATRWVFSCTVAVPAPTDADCADNSGGLSFLKNRLQSIFPSVCRMSCPQGKSDIKCYDSGCVCYSRLKDGSPICHCVVPIESP